MTAIASALLATASTASAGLVGLLDLSTNTGYSNTTNLTGTPLPDGSLLWSHQVSDPEFTATATIIGNVEDAAVSTAVQFVSGSTEMLSVDMGFTMPLGLDPLGAEWTSSISISLSGLNASLQSASLDGLWTAGPDGQAVAAFMPFPFELVSDGGGSNTAFASGAGSTPLASADELMWRIRFDLSPQSTVVINGAYATIPSPASLAVLFALSFSSRRRRAT